MNQNTPSKNYALFLLREIKCLAMAWEGFCLITFSLISVFFLVKLDSELNEISKAVCGGIVSSFLFYIFVDYLPKISQKRQQILRFAREVQRCLDYSDSIFNKLTSEWTEAIQSKNDSKFFTILKDQSMFYQPSSVNLKAVKNIVAANPIEFEYCNLGEILTSEMVRFNDRIQALDRVAAAVNLEVWDFESQLEIHSALSWKSSAIRMGEKNLSLMKNSAAAFGTDLDILHKKIYEI